LKIEKNEGRLERVGYGVYRDKMREERESIERLKKIGGKGKGPQLNT